MSRHWASSYRISSLALIPLVLQGVRSPVVGSDVHTKSNLDNIVGSLWQARQESSGSSVGAQVIISPSPSPHLNNILPTKQYRVIRIPGRVLPRNTLSHSQGEIWWKPWQCVSIVVWWWLLPLVLIISVVNQTQTCCSGLSSSSAFRPASSGA